MCICPLSGNSNLTGITFVNHRIHGGHGLGPVVQSIISLTSLLVVKTLSVLISTISNSQVFSTEQI